MKSFDLENATIKALTEGLKTSLKIKNEEKEVKKEDYNYYWKDDIEEVESNEANDDIWYAVAENIQETDPDYKDYDVYEIMSDIISIWKIEKRSRLYDYLLKWYGSEEELLNNVRDVYDTDRAIYFVTGCGYSIFSADLLGGTADGIAERDFDRFVNNGGKKEESADKGDMSKETKTEGRYATKEELTEVAKAYCEKMGYTFIFANEDKFGFETKDGQLWTLDYFALADKLKDTENKQVKSESTEE